jgi:diadenosine tetraphosphate (Ap4A) HIT family hydrolase
MPMTLRSWTSGRPVPGKILVAPKAHVEHVARYVDEAACSWLMLFVREMALAVEAVCEPELTCLYSLGSRQGNTHLQWHIAAVQPGIPSPEQQFHALMTENGVLALPPYQAAAIARGCVGRSSPGITVGGCAAGPHSLIDEGLSGGSWADNRATVKDRAPDVRRHGTFT